LIVWKYYNDTFGFERTEAIRFKPCHHSKTSSELPDDFFVNLQDKNILVVDFSFPLEVTNKIISVAKSLYILDHHITAMKDLDSLCCDNKHFDMTKSGAMLAWDFFYTSPAPLLVNYIQDRDLWHNTLENSKAFVVAFQTESFHFENWSKYFDDDALMAKIEEGNTMLVYSETLVQRAVKLLILYFANTKASISLLDTITHHSFGQKLAAECCPIPIWILQWCGVTMEKQTKPPLG